MTRRRILPPTYLLYALLGMIALHFTVPVVKIIPAPWNILGVLSLASGIAMNLSADHLLHLQKTTVKPFEPSTTLVVKGVYRFSRNPMYMGFALVLTGAAILLGSLSAFIVIPIFVLIIDKVYIEAEERMLADRFGEEWTDYRKQTRRWI
jgi:protein-S-isoprenylcysteine O-methyltransferase Ste14